MALNSGLTQTIQVGIREELADLLAVVDAKETIFVSAAKKGRDIGNMKFEWQVDAFASPKLGGVSDGQDVTYGANSNASNQRTRISNYAQVFRRDARVGFIAETQNVAGIGGTEEARAISKRMRETKRDMEQTFLLTNQVAQVESSNTVPYMTASLGRWILANDGGTPATGKTPQAFAPNTNAVNTTNTVNFTEAVAQDVLLGLYSKTGQIRDYTAIVGTTLKRAFTNLTLPNPASSTGIYNSNSTNTVQALAIRTFSMDIDATYRSAVDIFQGDFGRFIVTPSVFMGSTDNDTSAPTLTSIAYKGYAVPMDLCEIRYAQLPKIQPLPDSGGGPGFLCQAIAGLVVANPSGFGAFNGSN